MTETHTRREIHQQPAVWREAARSLAARRDEVDSFVAPVLGKAEARVVLTGAGTSAFTGQVAAPALSRRLGRRIEAIPTTDLVSSPADLLVPDVPTLLVSFARSGDSPESRAATAVADRLLSNVRHLVLTCNPDGALATEHADRPESLVLNMPAAANDQGFAMTSSFTSMLLTALLALGRYPGDPVDPVDLADTVEALSAAAEAVLAEERSVADLAPTRPERLVYLGSGPLTGLAHESALKVMELTAGEVAAIGDSPMAFRHGPKAFLDETTRVVVFVSNDEHTRRYDLDLVEELRRDLPPGRLVVVDAGGGDHHPGVQVVRLPGLAGVEDALLAVPAVLVAQIIGLEASLALDHTPDNPFPTGEVNRVVQGVRIHPLPELG